MASGALVIERFKAERKRREGKDSFDFSADCTIASLQGKIRKDKGSSNRAGKNYGFSKHGSAKKAQSLKLELVEDNKLVAYEGKGKFVDLAGVASLNLPHTPQ